MTTAHEHAIFTDAATSSAGQFGSGTQRRQLALERYVAAIAGDGHLHRRTMGSAGSKSQSTSGIPPIGEATVSTIMSTDTFSLPATATFGEVLTALTDRQITATPVVDRDGVVIGVVSEADLLARAVRSDRPLSSAPTGPHPAPSAESRLTAADLMSSPAITITADASITDAATIAAQGHVKRLPVIDPAGRLIGLITRGDLLAAYVDQADPKASEPSPKTLPCRNT
jgi:CBS domain-containing protein